MFSCHTITNIAANYGGSQSVPKKSINMHQTESISLERSEFSITISGEQTPDYALTFFFSLLFSFINTKTRKIIINPLYKKIIPK